ncbi:class I SAM-dependent methyltransferase [Actinomyces israelii]|uniref:class I SAM-dependent methyltransferase n=1 Tax=Actinomyces israelii TaxID=1659 RepID=UPI0005BBDCAC|nr:class I SAM-dependent methyltransferase [Actinomyces israelii]
MTAVSALAAGARERVDLAGASQTLLLPLHARAEHTLSSRPRFEDWAAVDLVSRLDYDFSEAARDRLMSDGVILRTLTLDPLVSGFISTHPDAVVVNVACGLDTRFHRLDNGRITWFDLDLPDVIALRRQLLGEGERRHLIAASALDPDWPEQVEAAGDVLVVVEGLTMYLTEDQVRGLMGIIAGSLPGATVLVEVMPRLFQRYGRERSVVATGARFTYGCSGAEEFRRTVAPGFALLHDVLLTDVIGRMHPWLTPLLGLAPARRLSQRILVLRAAPATRRR